MESLALEKAGQLFPSNKRDYCKQSIVFYRMLNTEIVLGIFMPILAKDSKGHYKENISGK